MELGCLEGLGEKTHSLSFPFDKTFFFFFFCDQMIGARVRSGLTGSRVKKVLQISVWDSSQGK